MRIAINGFGRIGRLVFRAGFDNPSIDFVAINDITDAKTLAHLLKYDSVHGIFKANIESGDDYISVNGKKIKIFSLRDPQDLPWKELNIDIVVESTGIFRTFELSNKHIIAGAKKVVLSAPAKSEGIKTVVLGVNDKDIDFKNEKIISNASCTTNCLAPMVKVLDDNFGIEHGFMTTIHSYTNDQRILDLPHRDLRRARAAAVNMIPTTTGATKAIGLVIPHLKGKLKGLSVRVPTPDVSFTDLSVIVKKEVSKEEVNNAFKQASNSILKNYLQYVDEPLVSMDLKGNPYSSIFDSLLTEVIEGSLVKVFGWYDNEWGYSNRIKDLLLVLGKYL